MLQRRPSVVLRSVIAGLVGMALAAIGLVAGCGQKGPLTLPKPPPAAPSSAASSATSPASAASPS